MLHRTTQTDHLTDVKQCKNLGNNINVWRYHKIQKKKKKIKKKNSQSYYNDKTFQTVEPKNPAILELRLPKNNEERIEK